MFLGGALAKTKFTEASTLFNQPRKKTIGNRDGGDFYFDLVADVKAGGEYREGKVGKSENSRKLNI